ncbi:hypothetical protein ACFVH6_44450 [Spirillospora sp. NPDC127200]
MVDPLYPRETQPRAPENAGYAAGGTADRTVVRAGRLWAGGLATAVVAALVVLVGLMAARGVLDVPVAGPDTDRLVGDSPGLTYALLAGGAALVGTALLHGMLLTVPSPLKFFGWIGGLATAAFALAPLALHSDLVAGLVAGAINLVAGTAVTVLLISVGSATCEQAERR